MAFTLAKFIIVRLKSEAARDQWSVVNLILSLYDVDTAP